MEFWSVIVWLICAGVILGMLLRPRGWAEAYWACGGALLLLVLRRISPGGVCAAVGKGGEVYLFLAGMMLLSEFAREEGVFDWLAGIAVRGARGSAGRLFVLVYLTGVAVTTFLSNDATAVVLTPAVLAAVRRARVEPRPHLLACAFVANAASFVLPVSNPANLVVFGNRPPVLREWLQRFGAPAAAAIAVTFFVVRWFERGELRGCVAATPEPCRLSRRGKWTFACLLASACALIAVSFTGRGLGYATLIAALATALIVHWRRPRGMLKAASHVSWSVLPLVAGLFVLVAALEGAGAYRLTAVGLGAAERMRPLPGALSCGFCVGALANIMNNLPVGLIAAGGVGAFHPPAHLASALLIGVDLGPNLSVTGSLATILWLIALRRENVSITAAQFLRVGAVLMPLALAASLLALRP